MSHYYEKLSDGKVVPRHFVEMTTKSGTRPTRITDVKKWRAEGRTVESSVTTVLSILDKRALNDWKISQHLETVYDNKVLPSDFADFAAFEAHIKSLTQDRLDIAPQAGTDIHKSLEDYISKGILPANEIEQTLCKNVEAALAQHTGIHLSRWRCEEYFLDEEHGYAGCTDLICDSKENWVIDFKSKQKKEKMTGKLVYEDHYCQLAAYGRAFFGNHAFRAANIFVCLENGDVIFSEHSQADIIKGWLDFQDCLSIYKRREKK